MAKALNFLKKLSPKSYEEETPNGLFGDDLLWEIDETLSELKQARHLFQSACEPEEVDSCVYKIKSVEARYNYLLRVAKETNTVRWLGVGRSRF